MIVLRKAVGWVVLFACVLSLAQDKAARPARDKQGKDLPKPKLHRGVSKPPAALVEKPAPVPTPQPPPPPLTPGQKAPTPPQVSYSNGLLTVVADNSTLGDILRAVQAKTGASIDFPVGQASDRVIAKLGPAPAPSILTTLLNGSRFDYILVGTPGRPDLLTKAILTARAPGATETAAAKPPQPKPAAAPPPPEEEEAPEETEPPEEVQQPPPQVQPQPGQPQPGQVQPGQPQPFGQPIQPGQPMQPGQPQGQQPKTPEQLLQELQQLQQQQMRQQQQQQNPQEQQQQ